MNKLANLISNDLSNLSVQSGGNIEKWNSGTNHGGWTVDTPVELISGNNDGFPPGNTFSSAVKLTVDNSEGRIFTEVNLTQGATYKIEWQDARDHHNIASAAAETDKYSVRISQSSGTTSGDHEYEAPFDCAEQWTPRSHTFSPKMTGKYYISFKGKSRTDNKKRGALITLVSMTVQDGAPKKNRKVTLDSGGTDIVLLKGKSNKEAISFHLEEDGHGLNGELMHFTLTQGTAHPRFPDSTHGYLSYNSTTEYGGKFVINAEALSAGDVEGEAKLTVTDSLQSSSWDFRIVVGEPWKLELIGPEPQIVSGHTGHITVRLTKDDSPVEGEELQYASVQQADYRFDPSPGKTNRNGECDINITAVGNAGTGTLEIYHRSKTSPLLLVTVHVTAPLYGLKSDAIHNDELLTIYVGENKRCPIQLYDLQTGNEVQGQALTCQYATTPTFKAEFSGPTGNDGTATLELTGIQATHAPETVTIEHSQASPLTFHVAVAPIRYQLQETHPGEHELALHADLTLGVRVSSNTGPVAGMKVQLTIMDNDGTGATFDNNKTEFSTESESDGTLSVQLLGAHKTGHIVVRATAEGAAPLNIDVDVVEQATIVVATILKEPEPVSPNMAFRENIQVMITRMVGTNFEPVDGVDVRFTIECTSQATAPFFLKDGNHLHEVKVQTKDWGIATAPALRAGMQAGSYKVDISTPHQTKPASLTIMVIGIAQLQPSARTVDATQRDLVRSKWFVKALDADSNPAVDQPVMFTIVDSTNTGSVFEANRGLVAHGTSASTTGEVCVPDIQIGEAVGTFQVVVAGTSGTPTATITVHVNAAKVPHDIKFDENTPKQVKGGATLRPGAIAVHVTDVNNLNIISGHVTFTISDDGHTGTVFSSDRKTTATADITDGWAMAPAIALGSSGKFTITATVDSTTVSASHPITIV